MFYNDKKCKKIRNVCTLNSHGPIKISQLYRLYCRKCADKMNFQCFRNLFSLLFRFQCTYGISWYAQRSIVLMDLYMSFSLSIFNMTFLCITLYLTKLPIHAQLLTISIQRICMEKRNQLHQCHRIVILQYYISIYLCVKSHGLTL